MNFSKTFFLPAVLMLSQFEIKDQFNQTVEWKNFEEAPHILVFAGKAAAKEAQAWGIFLHDNFNSHLKPAKEHLQATLPTEKIKVVAVASLPDVPGIFKGMFRSGFRKESSSMPLALDFSQRLSKTFTYDADEKEPLLVFLHKGRFLLPTGGVAPKDIQESEGSEREVALLRGLVSNVETQQRVLELANELIKTPVIAPVVATPSAQVAAPLSAPLSAPVLGKDKKDAPAP